MFPSCTLPAGEIPPCEFGVWPFFCLLPKRLRAVTPAAMTPPPIATFPHGIDLSTEPMLDGAARVPTAYQIKSSKKKK